jgi:hypothetical protein
MSIKNVFSFSRYTVDIVDGRIYAYACYALTQHGALEAASAVHIAARGSLAFATEATVKGPCHDSNCTLGDNCTMTVERVKTDDLGLTN